MDYKVIFTENAMEDMDSIVEYLLFHCVINKQPVILSILLKIENSY